jgi:CheY-like chemotaxis protein
LLRGTRFRIIEANASEAAERARFEIPRLILLDLMMPDRSGFEVLDDLKLDERTRDIAVVIHSSKTLTESDMNRLAGRQFSILPKGETGRLSALLAIRALLNEPALFSSEPEFRDKSSAGNEMHV